MRSRIILAFALLLIMPLPLAAAYAQQAPAPEELFQERKPAPIRPPPKTQPGTMPADRLQLPEEEAPPKKLYDSIEDIPTEVLQDAKRFESYCTNNTLIKRHYNCECLSSKYLDQRIIDGPDAHFTVVMSKIMDQCFDIPAAAAHGYDRCIGTGSMTYDGGMDPEEYCQCVANNYALLVQRSKGAISGRITSHAMSSATLRCQTPPVGKENPFRRLDNPKAPLP